MRLISAFALAFTLPTVAYAQAPVNKWCWIAPPVDSIRALAARLHPEALKPAVSRDSLLIGLILDRSCQVVQHAVGRRPIDSLRVDDALAFVFPGYRELPMVVSGFAEATPQRAPGSPWIVWLVKRTDG